VFLRAFSLRCTACSSERSLTNPACIAFRGFAGFCSENFTDRRNDREKIQQGAIVFRSRPPRTRVWNDLMVIQILVNRAKLFPYRVSVSGCLRWFLCSQQFSLTGPRGTAVRLDDDFYVTKNALLTAPDGLRRIWFSLESPSQYFPLTYTSFRIERTLWGLRPLAIIGSIFFSTPQMRAPMATVNRAGSSRRVAGGRHFRVAPVQVESVAWITERKNMLMAFFFLLTLLGWARFIDERNQRAIQRSRAHRKQRAKEVTQAGNPIRHRGAFTGWP